MSGCSGASWTLGRSKNRVNAGGEDADSGGLESGVVCGVEREVDLGPFAAADPVALHGAHLLGPTIELIEPVEKLLRVCRDAVEPLLEIALLDGVIFMTPAAAVDHLLIGKHSLHKGSTSSPCFALRYAKPRS